MPFTVGWTTCGKGRTEVTLCDLGRIPVCFLDLGRLRLFWFRESQRANIQTTHDLYRQPTRDDPMK